MVSYDLLLFMLKIETLTGRTNSMPFLVIRRDHLQCTSEIICGSGSSSVHHSGQMIAHAHSGQTQKSNATSGFRRLELRKSLKRKPARLLWENVIKIVL